MEAVTGISLADPNDKGKSRGKTKTHRLCAHDDASLHDRCLVLASIVGI